MTDQLAALRLRGMRMLVLLGWLATASLGLVGVIAQADGTTGVVLAGALVMIAPTWYAAHGHSDLSARLSAGTLAAALPALLVYLLRGHEWQMDGHMYFFVALGALVVLCDWRPVLVAGAMIAAHHLLLEMFAPAWVFSGSGAIARVVIHALAVVLQGATLSYIAIRLADLIRGQQAAQLRAEESARLAETERLAADDARRSAVTALRQASEAGRLAASERDRRETLERDTATQRQAELQTLADRLETSIGAMATLLDDASKALQQSAGTLGTLAADAGDQVLVVAQGAQQALNATRQVAGSMGDLTRSIGAISGSADQQGAVMHGAQDNAQASDAAIRLLADGTNGIDRLADEIAAIAGRTNLLALNATIEAARAGDAGRGFAVVAGEVKALAGQAKQASGQIGRLVEAVQSGVDVAAINIGQASAAVEEVTAAAGTIRAAVADQRDATYAIQRHAEDAVANAGLVGSGVDDVSRAVQATQALATEVSDAATAVAHTAQRLRHASDDLLRHLRAPGEMRDAA